MVDALAARPFGRSPAWRWSAVGDGLLLYGAVTLALLPVGYLLITSFNIAPFGAPYHFGLANWWQVATSPSSYRTTFMTFLLASRVVVAFFIALAISWAIVRVRIAGRRFVEVSLWFAFFLPMAPVAMAWIALLHKDYGLINQAIATLPFMPRHVFSIHSVGGIMWVYLTVGTVPFLTIIFTPVFRQMDAAFEEAARVHGASGRQTFLRVTLPMLLPALLVGFIGMYIRSLESFEVEQLVGTPARIFVFATTIYDLLRHDPPMVGQAMALGTFFLAIALLLAGAQAVYARRHPAVVTVRAQNFRTAIAGGRFLRPAASIAVIAFVLIAIYLPVGMILAGSCNRIFGFFRMAEPWTLEHWRAVLIDDRFAHALRNSLLFGVGIGALVLPVYLRLGWILARGTVGGGAVAGLLLWLPWAVPGFALGLALLDTLLRIDFLAMFYGTAFPIAFAFLIKEMPIGVHLLKVAVEQNGRDLEEAARISGAKSGQAFARITLPLLSPTVIGVFVIVFAAVIKEVSTIVLIASPGTETLSLLMFDYATNGRSESAAVIGVIFAAVSMALAIAVHRRLVPTFSR